MQKKQGRAGLANLNGIDTGMNLKAKLLYIKNVLSISSLGPAGLEIYSATF